MATSKIKVAETDPFGTDRYMALKREILSFKLGNIEQRRLEKINMVFLHRTDLAHRLHHAKDNYPSWEATNLKARIDTFKSIQFFLDAMQTLLNDIRREDAILKAAKPKPATRRYGTGW